MALIQRSMVEVATSTDTLTLEMPNGQSALVREIRTQRDSKTVENFIVKIDRKAVFQVANPISWLMCQQTTDWDYKLLAERLIEAGLWPTFPVESGQTFTVENQDGNNWDYIEVVYDLFDEGDVTAADRNGSASDTYRLFQMISNSGTIGSAGDLDLDQSDLNGVFPAFPGGDEVPANTEMQLLGLYGGPASADDGASGHGQHCTRLKMVRDRETMFDKDMEGIVFLGDADETAATTYTTDGGRLVLPDQTRDAGIIQYADPILFGEGEELNVSATIAHTAAGLAAGEVKLGMILDVVRR